MNLEDKFTFESDEKGRSFALEIAKTMECLFDIPLVEAIGRVNREWKDVKIFGQDQVYRRYPEEWARIIYYEVGTYWWVEKWMAENTPKPKPYP